MELPINLSWKSKCTKAWGSRNHSFHWFPPWHRLTLACMVLQFRCLSPFWGQQRFAKGVCFSPRGPISSGVSQSSPLMFPSLQGTVAEHCKSVTCSFSTAGLQPLSRIRKPPGTQVTHRTHSQTHYVCCANVFVWLFGWQWQVRLQQHKFSTTTDKSNWKPTFHWSSVVSLSLRFRWHFWLTIPQSTSVMGLNDGLLTSVH